MSQRSMACQRAEGQMAQGEKKRPHKAGVSR